MSEDDRQDILRRLEEGQIGVDEALQALDTPTGEEPDAPVRPRLWRLWWAICLGGGLGLAVMAAGVATLGGWWWLCAVPAGIVALALMALGVLSADAPWLQIHIDTGSESWPQVIRLGLPLPLRPAAWILRRWPGRGPSLRGTALDELILTLEENLQGSTPMVIDVHEGRGGERVRLHIG
jgi:hypothetical protein